MLSYNKFRYNAKEIINDKKETTKANEKGESKK